MAEKHFNPESEAVRQLLANLNSPFKMRLFYLLKLPSLFFWRVRILSVTPDTGQVGIPLSWRSQNPFRSTYFAALAGAGELSTGMLAMIAMAGRPPMSMLVTRFSASYSKKAVGMTVFTCSDGGIIREAIQRAYDTGEGQEAEVVSIGRGPDGAEVCRVTLQWSFKSKK